MSNSLFAYDCELVGLLLVLLFTLAIIDSQKPIVETVVILLFFQSLLQTLIFLHVFKVSAGIYRSRLMTVAVMAQAITQRRYRRVLDNCEIRAAIESAPHLILGVELVREIRFCRDHVRILGLVQTDNLQRLLLLQRSVNLHMTLEATGTLIKSLT